MWVSATVSTTAAMTLITGNDRATMELSLSLRCQFNSQPIIVITPAIRKETVALLNHYLLLLSVSIADAKRHNIGNNR